MRKKIKRSRHALPINAKQVSLSKNRVFLVAFGILFLSGAIILQLYKVQVLRQDKYVNLAKKQHRSNKTISPLRGEIFLREKEDKFAVAVNKELKTVFAMPNEIDSPGETASKLAPLLDLNEDKVFRKLSKENDRYEILKRKVERDVSEKIKELDLDGIYFESEYWRYYPAGSLASQVIGFVGYKGDDLFGQYGIESQFESRLCGKEGLIEQERDVFDRWISIGSKSVIPEINGQDIVLTLDHVLQFKAELALENAIKRHEAEGGRIIISDPYTGEILAMTSYPNFDLNRYSKVDDIAVFKNSIITNEYECGSVFKPITMAIGLDTEKVTPESTYIDTGAVAEAGFVIKNSDEKSNGKQTMTQVIEKSLNTGVIHVEKEVGNQEFFRYVKDFGFGQVTGITLPGEADGNLRNLKTQRDIEYFTASFGQGITVTPIQLIMSYGAMANGGKLMKPGIVKSFTDVNGKQQEYIPQEKRSVISQKTSNQISLMLESNVDKGHGKLAGVPGYRVAGKTGTAQIPDKEKGGYLEDATTGTFAGYGPVENPIFAMVVIIDYPKDVEWAESTAAPVFGELAKFMFDYYRVEPTREYTSKDLEKFAKTHNYLASDKEIQKEREREKLEKEEEDKTINNL